VGRGGGDKREEGRRDKGKVIKIKGEVEGVGGVGAFLSDLLGLFFHGDVSEGIFW